MQFRKTHFARKTCLLDVVFFMTIRDPACSEDQMGSGQTHGVIQQWPDPPFAYPRDNCRGWEVSKLVTPSLSDTHTRIDTETSSTLLQCGFSFSNRSDRILGLVLGHSLLPILFYATPPSTFFVNQLPSVHLTMDRLEPVIYLALQWSQAD